MPLTVRLDHELSPGVWTDLAGDLIRDQIRGFSGISGTGPLDRMAGPGGLSYTFDNTELNSAGVSSRYSPGHSNALAGFRRGTRVRLHVSDGVNARYIWAGYLDVIDPEPGVSGLRATTVTAVDWFGYFADYDATGLALRQGVTSDELMGDLVGGVPRQPASRDFDVGLDEYAIAFDDLAGTPKAVPVGHDILSSGLEYLYLRGNATNGEELRMETRHARTLASVAATFTGVDLENSVSAYRAPDDPEHIYNDISLQAVPRSIDAPASETVLFKQDAPTEVAPGKTEEIWLEFQDPDNEAEHVGALDGLPSEVVTDWTANAQQDGGGADLSADFAVTYTWFGSDVLVQMTNNGTVPGFVRGPGGAEGAQGRGRAIKRYRPVTRKATNSASITTYGSRQLPAPLLMVYQQSLAVAQGLAEFMANVWSTSNTPRVWRLPSELGDEYLAHGINRDIGDKIRLSEGQTGVDEAVCIIHRRDFEISLDGRLFTLWTLAPADTSATMIWNDPVAGIWNANVWGYA